MNKLDALREIFYIENLFEIVDQDIMDISGEEFLIGICQLSYNLKEVLGSNATNVAKFTKRVFPTKARHNNKVDTWLLNLYGCKYCGNCKKVLWLESFSANRSNLDNLNSYCKSCVVENATEYQREYQSRVRAKKKQRLPAWADLKAIREKYSDCPEGLQVDHIFPLQGKLVSGLHIAENLQYLSARENQIKGNKYTIAP